MVWPKSAPTRAAAATLLPLLAAGMLARLSLAESLRASGELMCSTIDAVSGEVGPAGRLAAATGKLTPKMSVDAGMYSVVLPMHQLSVAAGLACQASGSWRPSCVWLFVDPLVGPGGGGGGGLHTPAVAPQVHQLLATTPCLLAVGDGALRLCALGGGCVSPHVHLSAPAVHATGGHCSLDGQVRAEAPEIHLFFTQGCL